MWCYQKPGFEALLLSELQKQQQSSQFCDTVLKADGVSVPAHSCVLSALSHQFSSLSSSPDLGQKRLVEFPSLGACTLLHLIRLLYSGQMVGEGEREKQEVVSAAAKLGIHGLVEVSSVEVEHSKVQDGRIYAEVGVQTDSQIIVEDHVRLRGWRREVKDGATLLWRERLPTQGSEMWTQTDNQLTSGTSPQPSVTYETIDLNAFQTLSQTEPLQIPFVPMPVAHPNNYGYGQSSVSPAIPSAAVHFSSVQHNVYNIPSQAFPPCAVETPHWNQKLSRAADPGEWVEEGFEQFEGNIPGFINYFLNPAHEEDSKQGRRQGRRRQGVGGTRQPGTRARPRGKRGGLTQTVDVQDVAVSKLSKMYLQRWGMYVNRTGQGGGAVGRRLCVKSREVVRSRRCAQGRKGRGIDWDLNQCATMPVKTRGQRGRPRSRGTPLLQRAQVVAKQPPAQGLEERPEHIDLLLEDVMMGLDILPSNKTTSKPTPRTRRCETPVSVAKKRKPDGSTAVVVASGGRDMASSEGPVLQQQQNEGEIPDILDQFLQSFEQLESVAAQDSTESEPHTNVNQYRKPNLQEDSVQPLGTPTRSKSTPETRGTDSPMGLSLTSAHIQLHKNSSPAVRRTRRKRDFLFSLEKPRAKCKKVSANSALKKEEVKHLTTKQLKQIPVVQLERRRFLPENLKKVVSQSPSPRARHSTSANMSTKTYPIRSRFKESHNTDILSTPREKMEHIKEVESTTRKGRKRALVSNNEESSSVEVKRIKLLNSPSQMTDADVIDVETISLSSTHNPVLIDNMEEETDLILEVCSTNADQESNDIIDVDSLDEDLDKTRGLERELVHAEVICSLKADIVTTGEDLDNDIDVTGGSSPTPTPVLISWTDSSEIEDDMGSESSEEMTVVLSKGRLVRC